MPITHIDQNTALVLIDLQTGIANENCVHPTTKILENAASLVQCFRKLSLPIVIVHVDFSEDRKDLLTPRSQVTVPVTIKAGWEKIVPQIVVESSDILITKRSWNAFYGTELDLQLRRRKIEGIVLAGVRTSIGVEGTARAAYERGYNITFAEDATSDYDLPSHEHSFTKIFPRIGEIDATSAIVKLITQQFTIAITQ